MTPAIALLGTGAVTAISRSRKGSDRRKNPRIAIVLALVTMAAVTVLGVIFASKPAQSAWLERCSQDWMKTIENLENTYAEK